MKGIKRLQHVEQRLQANRRNKQSTNLVTEQKQFSKKKVIRMFGYRRSVIAQHERALLFREGSLVQFLGPGVYRWFNPLGRLTLEIYDITHPEFAHPLEDFIAKRTSLQEEGFLQKVELAEWEVGLVYKNAQLADILPPGSRCMYWQGPIEIRVETLSIKDSYLVPKEITQLLMATYPGALSAEVTHQVYTKTVADHEQGLLIVNGELREQLVPGTYAYWCFHRDIQVEVVDMRLQPMEVGGQDMLTRDRISLRINLSASYQIADPIKARAGLSNCKDFLYRELQFGLRQAVGIRSLDELLADKGLLDADIHKYIQAKVEVYGIQVQSVGLKDVILPGEIKDILTQVVEAEKIAEANVLKRREETAATRSLLNTAKLMDENPTLLRLKELEMLEKITDKIDRLTVFGGLEGVLQELIKIRPGT